MTETDPEELAHRLQDQADDLERHSHELGQDAEAAAQEWQRKRSDPNVPGAPPPAEDEGEDQESTPTGSPTGKGDDEDQTR